MTLPRILWLAHRDPFHPKAGGAERSIKEITTILSHFGHEITILSVKWNGSNSITHMGYVTIRRFGNSFMLHLYVPLFILKKKPDVIVNDLGHAVPWPSTILLNKKNIIFFRHLHARSLPGQVKPAIAKLITAIERCYFILYHNAIFITESTTSVNDLLTLGIQKDKIIMNPPGVNRRLFYPMTKSKYPSLVYFGGMRKYKRPEEAVYLLKSLLDRIKGIKLYIVGTGPEENKVKKLVNDLNLQDFTSFKGRLSETELSNVVASSWLNVHSSVTEGWGLSILESTAAGTPTVAYDVPGVKDAIEDGKNGIKVTDGDRELLSEAAYKILCNPQMWWSSSIEVAKKYSWDQTADLWDKLIREVSINVERRLPTEK